MRSAILEEDLRPFLRDLSKVKGLRAAMLVERSGARVVLDDGWDDAIALSEIHNASFNLLQDRYGEQASVIVEYKEQVLGVYALGQDAALVALCPDAAIEEDMRRRWSVKHDAWLMCLEKHFFEEAHLREYDAAAEADSGEVKLCAAQALANDFAPVFEDGLELEEREQESARPTHTDAASDDSPAISVLGRGGEEDLGALLEEARRCFFEFYSDDPSGEAPAPSKEEDFQALVKEWSSFCEPDVFSFPMLLDSLSQSLGDDRTRRADFMTKMQSILARYMG